MTLFGGARRNNKLATAAARTFEAAGAVRATYGVFILTALEALARRLGTARNVCHMHNDNGTVMITWPWLKNASTDI